MLTEANSIGKSSKDKNGDFRPFIEFEEEKSSDSLDFGKEDFDFSGKLIERKLDGTTASHIGEYSI